ncbi:MAG TPA: hypothetical protein PKA16_04535 [Ottowia sp.]|uniref:hypothetical protein n=1 Tax=Ottowia sp. TaxID=1898956 RepID=UPI002D01080F|nr:hypothetical protein [Ottowia sp.]HMN20642.1 hypothetical protein [Ottowia sp.]
MSAFTPLLVLAALAVALALRPWRLLAGGALASPLLAALVITPWLWALPWLQPMPMRLQLSGACLITLALGWPLAVPVLCAIGLVTGLIAPLDFAQQLDLTLWLGIVPATLAMGLGLALRRWLPHNPFIYILGRGFLGTVACLMATALLAQWAGRPLATSTEPELAWVARWLLAWGDAVLTGMLAAICVAYRPEWLATWSDRIYIAPPPPDPG